MANRKQKHINISRSQLLDSIRVVYYSCYGATGENGQYCGLGYCSAYYSPLYTNDAHSESSVREVRGFQPIGDLILMSPLSTSVHPNEPPYASGHDSMVQALAASPDGRLIASTSDDQTLIIWRVDRGPEVALDWFTGEDIYELHFSPDSRYLASIPVRIEQQQQQIYIWDVTTGTLLETLGGTRVSSEITSQVCMAWLQDGTLVMSDITTKTKRLLRWCTVPSKEHTGSGLTTPPSVAVPPDATYSLTDRGLVQVADCHQPTETVSLPQNSLSHSISRDGSLLAHLGPDTRGVTMWDMDFGTPSPPRHIQPPPLFGWGSCPFAVSDLATQRSFIIYREDNCRWRYSIVERVVDSNAPVAQRGNPQLDMFEGEYMWMRRMWFSPCGRLFATTTRTGSGVHLWRANGMRLATFNPPDHLPPDPFLAEAGIACGTFTQDSQTLVYGDSKGRVYIRDIGNFDVLAEETATVAQ